MTFDERVAAIRARARYMGVNTVDLTDLFTVEIGGQDDDVIITRQTAEYLYRQLGDLLGGDRPADCPTCGTYLDGRGDCPEGCTDNNH